MTKKLYKLMNWADVEGIVYAEEDDPHRLLGPHVRGMNTMIQFFYPGAVSAVIVIGKNRYAMELADEETEIEGEIEDGYTTFWAHTR